MQSLPHDGVENPTRGRYCSDLACNGARPRYNCGVEKPPVKIIVTPVISALRQLPPKSENESMTCDRCGAEMYRMHAVWRCSSCRFKTDCCGW
jgi:hypothetical protein